MKGKTAEQKSRQRFQILNEFVDQTMKDSRLTPTAKLVWFVIYKNTTDDLATLSLKRIAEDGGMSRESARSGVNLLEKLGLLVIHSKGRKDHSYSKYTPFPSSILGAVSIPESGTEKPTETIPESGIDQGQNLV